MHDPYDVRVSRGCVVLNSTFTYIHVCRFTLPCRCGGLLLWSCFHQNFCQHRTNQIQLWEKYATPQNLACFALAHFCLVFFRPAPCRGIRPTARRDVMSGRQHRAVLARPQAAPLLQLIQPRHLLSQLCAHASTEHRSRYVSRPAYVIAVWRITTSCTERRSCRTRYIPTQVIYDEGPTIRVHVEYIGAFVLAYKTVWFVTASL